jgi:DNA repair protein RadC
MTALKSNSKRYEIKANKSDFKNVKITSAKDASEYARQFYFDDIEIFESCFIIMLNRANNTIGYAKISQGGISGTVIDVKIIAKLAVDSLASGIIMVHNHPSGNTRPSDEDLKITKKCKDGLSILDVNVLDHIILTSESYTSLADEGLL